MRDVMAGPWTARRRCVRSLRKLAQNFENLRVLRCLGDVVHVDIADDALLVDDHDGALADAFVLFPHAVLLRDFSLRMEVGEQRVMVDAAERLGECNVAWNAVYRNAHDLGVIPFKVGDFRLISRHLYGSDRGPVERIENDDDVLLSAHVTEFELLATAVTGQLEIGRLIADFERAGFRGGGSPASCYCHR